MGQSNLGIVLDSFMQPVKDALQSAARLAFRDVELPAVGEEVDPSVLSRSGRRHLLHYVNSLGLRLSALGSEAAGGRTDSSSELERRVEKTRRILEMAAELRVPIVTAHLGRVDEQTVQKGHVAQALRELAETADRTGAHVALDTTGADPAVLGRLLRDINTPLIGACYDPAALLIDGFDPLSGVEPLADQILSARVRDAVAGTGSRPGRETPVGAGQIDFAEYLAALDQAGYRSAPFIRRTGSDRPLQEIADARRRIEALIRR